MEKKRHCEDWLLVPDGIANAEYKCSKTSLLLLTETLVKQLVR